MLIGRNIQLGDLVICLHIYICQNLRVGSPCIGAPFTDCKSPKWAHQAVGEALASSILFTTFSWLWDRIEWRNTWQWSMQDGWCVDKKHFLVELLSHSYLVVTKCLTSLPTYLWYSPSYIQCCLIIEFLNNQSSRLHYKLLECQLGHQH